MSARRVAEVERFAYRMRPVSPHERDRLEEMLRRTLGRKLAAANAHPVTEIRYVYDDGTETPFEEGRIFVRALVPVAGETIPDGAVEMVRESWARAAREPKYEPMRVVMVDTDGVDALMFP